MLNALTRAMEFKIHYLKGSLATNFFNKCFLFVGSPVPQPCSVLVCQVTRASLSEQTKLIGFYLISD